MDIAAYLTQLFSWKSFQLKYANTFAELSGATHSRGHRRRLSADTPLLNLETLDISGAPSFCPEGTDTSEKGWPSITLVSGCVKCQCRPVGARTPAHFVFPGSIMAASYSGWGQLNGCEGAKQCHYMVYTEFDSCQDTCSLLCS